MSARDVADAIYAAVPYSDRAERIQERGIGNATFNELHEALVEGMKRAFRSKDRDTTKTILKGARALVAWRDQ